MKFSHITYTLERCTEMLRKPPTQGVLAHGVSGLLLTQEVLMSPEEKTS